MYMYMYMYAKLSLDPELYWHMQLPVFVEVLEIHNVQRKRALDKAKTTPVKKRRIENRAETVFALHLFDVSPEISHG